MSRAAGLIALAVFTLVMLSHFRGALGTFLQAADLPESARQSMLAQAARLAQVPVPTNLSAAQTAAAALAVKQAFADSFRLVCWGSGLLAVAGGVGVLELEKGRRLERHLRATRTTPAARSLPAPPAVLSETP